MLLDGAVFIDVDGGTFHLDVRRVGDAEHPVDSWDALKAALLDESLWKDAKAVVIDSLTRAEEMAIEWTIANVPHEKGHTIKSIEGYGYGKGYQYVFETFLQLLALLDTHIRAGRHVICIAHECVANVPNPEGEDWIRYEPRLQSLASGKASIRHRFKEWADHLFFVGFDVFAKDGKAKGAGTRTICCQESPAFWAKSRSLADPIVFSKGDNALWTALFGRDGK